MMPELLPGDIGAVKGRGVAAWLSRKLFLPHTDRFHFFVIAEYVGLKKDWIIYESIASKGLSAGWLSWYSFDEVEIYRVPDQSCGKLATLELILHGRALYDYFLPIKLFLGALRLVLTGRFPPWRPEQLPYGRDSRFLCTEAAAEAWRAVGYPIIPEGVCPLPAGFEQAIQEGKLVRIFPRGAD